MRIAFFGTSDFAGTILAHLISAQFIPVAIWTSPDRRSGRGMRVQHSPVKTIAQQHDICPIYQPQRGQDINAQIAPLDIDLILTVAYGLFLPQKTLQQPHWGSINIHPSLLPRWRGASPITAAIVAQDANTGVSLVSMTEAMDAGDILAQQAIAIEPHDTYGSLHDKLAELSQELTVKFLKQLDHASDEQRPSLLHGNKQKESEVSWAPKLSKQNQHLDCAQTAEDLAAWVKALYPQPKAKLKLWDTTIIVHGATAEPDTAQTKDLACGTVLTDSQQLRIKCGRGILRITELQLPSKRPISAQQYLNNHVKSHQG